MFDLVADVGNYAKFLPWVVATRVRSDSETEMVADMLIGFKAIREKFTSRVLKHRPDHIEVIYVDGPLKDLDNNWTFTATDDGGCEVDFCVEFTSVMPSSKRWPGSISTARFAKWSRLSKIARTNSMAAKTP